MRTPEVTELLRRLKQGRLPPNADAYTLAAEVECLEAEVEFYKRHGQEMTDVGNGLYRAIVARLEPHLPAGSRDLEWDVLPGTVGALAKRAETAEVRYVASQDALAECMGELRELEGSLANMTRDYEKLLLPLDALQPAKNSEEWGQLLSVSAMNRLRAAEARVKELECVRDALIRSEESAQQLEELVSNQAQEYIERAEAAEQRAEESERAFGLLEEAHKSTTEKFASTMARVAELEAQNARLRADKDRLDWIWADPYERLQEVRRMLPTSGYPRKNAEDGLRVAIDRAQAFMAPTTADQIMRDHADHAFEKFTTDTKGTP